MILRCSFQGCGYKLKYKLGKLSLKLEKIEQFCLENLMQIIDELNVDVVSYKFSKLKGR